MAAVTSGRRSTQAIANWVTTVLPPALGNGAQPFDEGQVGAQY